MFDPNEDGKTHINVYSKGKTFLGRSLSNFAFSPFHHPEDGVFNSVEGYWYWLSCKDDNLRKLSGWKAKEYGRKVGAKDWLKDDEFKRKIKLAIEAKLQRWGQVRQLLQSCSLPLTHYYCYGGKVVNVPEADWILEYLESFKCDI